MAEPEPGGRPPAPGGLTKVQAFINTFDIEDDEDDLTDPDALTAWLNDHHLLDDRDGGTRADHTDLANAHVLREALRDLIAAHNNLPADVPKATHEVNQAAARAKLAPRLTPDGTSTLEPTQRGVDGALGKLVAAVHEAANDGSWKRLKACERGHCRWAFYDASRNRSGRWCSMAVCGSREKSQRAYRRARTPRASPD